MNPAQSTTPDQRVTDLGPATVLNYKLSLKGAERAYRRADADDKKVISGMKSDCEFVIEWLNTGRRPGNKRGIERRAAYQREKLVDPMRLQAYVSNSKAGSPSNLSDWEYFQIEEALQLLSPMERECFTLSYGHCMPHSYIAEVLEMSRGNVSTLLQRAKDKIEDSRNNNLFLS